MSVLTSIPTDGFLGASHSGAAGIGVATAVFPIGSKVTVKQDAATGVTPGYCTFIYYQFDNGSGNIATSAKEYLQLFAANTEKLTSDVSDANTYGPGAIALGVITDTYYAFVQCGGPICNGNATALAVATLDGNFVTDTTVAAKGLNGWTGDTTIGAVTLISGGTMGTGWILSDTADTSATIDAEFLYILDKFAASL